MEGTNLDRARLPRHVAIIMDGNGRWAKMRGLPRSAGHRAGVEAVRRTVRAADELGIEVLTLYSFSSENWSRPRREISYLFSLLRRFVQRDVADLHARNVRVRIIGEREGLEEDIVGLLEHCERLTAANTGLTLVFAFNYGGRQEIARAARRLAEEVAAGRLDPAEITPQRLAGALYAPDLPEPDLVIRTSNEKRLSNFLLWQAAYAELVFVPEYWPEFDGETFRRALAEYAARERRFGGLSGSGGQRVVRQGA
jgi:undecaprenyl diphosphate synthase